jgi:hypothetical protein
MTFRDEEKRKENNPRGIGLLVMKNQHNLKTGERALPILET